MKLKKCGAKVRRNPALPNTIRMAFRIPIIGDIFVGMAYHVRSHPSHKFGMPASHIRAMGFTAAEVLSGSPYRSTFAAVKRQLFTLYITKASDFRSYCPKRPEGWKVVSRMDGRKSRQSIGQKRLTSSLPPTGSTSRPDVSELKNCKT